MSESIGTFTTVAKTGGSLLGLALPILFGVTVGRLVTPWLPGFSAWVDTLGAWAPLAFVVAYVVVVVCLLPAFLVTMAGGALFGVGKGAALVFAGATIGAVSAFLLGRTILRGWVNRRIASHPVLSNIDQVIGEDGLRLMFLLRLSPAVPFVLSNYALGVTSVRLRDFLLAMPGLLPVIVSYAALGHAGTLEAGGEQSLPGWVLVLGIVATLILGVLLARIAQKAMAASPSGH